MSKIFELPDFNGSNKLYKAVVFDLDGTLYNQTKLRIYMAMRLGFYYVSHFWKIKELLVLKLFREVRDNWDNISEDIGKSVDELQYEYVGAKEGVSAEYVKQVVHKWIYENPLDLLMKCRDENLYMYIEKLQSLKIPVIIFSDYPIADKIKALGITPNGMYCPGDERRIELKPSPMGLKLIMMDYGFNNSDLIMIGDRDSKDGEAARRADVDYFIV